MRPMRSSYVVWLSSSLIALTAVGCGGSQPQPETPPAEAEEPEAATDLAADSVETAEAPATDAATPEAEESEDSSKPSARRDAIAKVVKENRQKVRDCYDAGLKENPSLKGDLVIHFKVDAEGKVAMAELAAERSQITDPKVVECAIAAFKSLTFPPHAEGMDTEGNYPFNFNPK